MGKFKIRSPFIDLIEFESGEIAPEKFTELDFPKRALELTKRLKAHAASEVYARFASAEDLKPFIVQVVGELYYPMWAPSYIECMCRFLLNLPKLPGRLRQDLETKLKLPEQARQQEFAEAMEKDQGYTFFKDQFEWAKKTYPGIDKDFVDYINEEKPGIRARIEGQEYCAAHFGHPSKPELFVYFPVKSKQVLPPPNGSMPRAKVIGVISYNLNPPIIKMMPRIYLRAACLLAEIA